jgi:hypothetical protein
VNSGNFSARREPETVELILLQADGLPWAKIRAKLDGTDRYSSRWSQRVAADRLAGLFARSTGCALYKVTDRVEACGLDDDTHTE